jgi:hypothetical protein
VLLFECLDMLSCSRVELMVAVLAQMCLLCIAMVPYLVLALAYMALMVAVTLFVIATTKQLVRSWAIPTLLLLA